MSQFYKGQWTGGYPETVSGSGSTMRNTTGVREILPKVIEKYNIESLFDAPCGDRNWIKTVDLGCAYTGGDIVQEIVDDINLPEVVQFDVRVDKAPDVDLWLCRDLLFHFSDEDALICIDNMVKNSSIEYLLVTSHSMKDKDNRLNRPIRTGDFRVLILEEKDYFGLGQPIEVFEDPSDSPIAKFLLLFDLRKN